MKPRALDLFCGAGGVSVGLHRAGFDVVGVDIKPQRNYPFPFIQADATNPPVRLADFDFIWASPPCQGYSRLRHLPWLRDKVYPLLIEPVRAMLKSSGAVWCMENVEGAPLSGCVLCGRMFDLPVYRHRLFETSFFMMVPECPGHDQVIGSGRMPNDRRRGSLNASSGKGAWGKSPIVTVAGGQFKKADGERALGINWMTKVELAQAIPPAYSEFIGRQALLHITPAILNAAA